jgi:hypothetical protein
MKKVCRLLCFTAMLLVAVAVPLAEHGVAAAVPRQPGAIASPTVADSLPVPWGKKPGGVGATAPQLVADSLPVPWGKKPAATQG